MQLRSPSLNMDFARQSSLCHLCTCLKAEAVCSLTYETHVLQKSVETEIPSVDLHEGPPAERRVLHVPLLQRGLPFLLPWDKQLVSHLTFAREGFLPLNFLIQGARKESPASSVTGSLSSCNVQLCVWLKPASLAVWC